MRPPRRTEDAPLGAPLFLLNLKAYPPAVGTGALRLGRILEAEARRAGVAAALAPSAPDLAACAARLAVPVLAQHTDPLAAGARTGFLVPEAVRAAGGRGSLLNHSEHPLGRSQIRSTLPVLAAAHLTPVLCAGSVRRAGDLAGLTVPYLAIEPPELIGGKVSVSTARPEVIVRTVEAVRARSPRTHVLCGAGIQNGSDVAVALRLGAEGVLVASAVATAPDPRTVLRDLLSGF